MREQWARRLAMGTGALVLALSAVSAALINASGAKPEPGPRVAGVGDAVAEADPARILRGLAVFERSGCARCHSVAGKGNLRSPLDGVGSRMDRAQLRAWVLADESVREDLSPRAISAKQAYADMPEIELEELLGYLESLRD